MKKIIIGLVGETGAGKGAFVSYLQKKLKSKNFFKLRFSDALSQALLIFFDEVKKQDQQWLGAVLREKFGQDVLAKSIEKKIKNIKNGLILVDGIRLKEEEDMIRKNGGKIVYITAPSKIRWQRLGKRGEKKDDKVSFNKFLKIEQAITERHIKEIGNRADYRIDNSGLFVSFYQQIDKFLKNLGLK